MRSLSLLAGALFFSFVPVHGQIFVTSGKNVEEFSTTGTVINTDFITSSSTNDVLYNSNNGYLLVETASGIGEYNATTGAAINANFVTGLYSGWGMTISGGDLYVLNGNQIGVYNATTGAVINSSLVSGLTNSPYSVAVSSTDIFVSNFSTGTVSEYTLGGTLVNSHFITGLTGGAVDLYLSGNTLYVTTEQSTTSGSETGNHVGEYNATTGAAINANFIVVPATVASYGLQSITGNGTDLYVTYFGTQSGVAEYNETTGATVSTSLDSLAFPTSGIMGITVDTGLIAAPELKSFLYALMALAALGALCLRERYSPEMA